MKKGSGRVMKARREAEFLGFESQKFYCFIEIAWLWTYHRCRERNFPQDSHGKRKKRRERNSADFCKMFTEKKKKKGKCNKRCFDDN